MKILVLDMETFYDDEFSLKKLSPVEYILNPRFEVNGCAFMEGIGNEPFWVDGPDLPRYLATVDKSNTMCVGHNHLFDGSILAWRYGFVPKLSCCTLSVSQATIRYRVNSLSLDSVSKTLGLGAKDTGALMSVKGMNLPMIKASGLYDRYTAYAKEDVVKCAGIFKLLVMSGLFPLCEIPILDLILRMTFQPFFQLDRDMLALHLNSVLQAKQKALSAIGSDTKSIRQDETFANMLRAQGVEPPLKISPKTGLTRYAFAKTDQDFQELEDHPNPVVQALVAARLGSKSTIEETRAQRFINISNLQWPIRFVGNMPMPVKFSAAHTHRGGGDWSLNVQNMTRGGMLRKSLKAPKGYKVMVVDSSQIEARLTAFLPNEIALLELFESGADVYSNFASTVYNKPINKNDNPDERFCGKTAVLGLGFGMGWVKFQRQLQSMSKVQLGKVIELSDDEAVRIVNTYRSTYRKIRDLWSWLNNVAIPVIANGGDALVLGPVVIEKGVVHIPGRLKMFYHNLEYKLTNGGGSGEWTFTFQGKPKKLYGGKLLENIVQYLDRILVFDAAARIQQRIAPYQLNQQAHDENGYVIREDHVELIRAILKEEMIRRPEWGLELPLMCEIGVGDSYGEAK